MAILSSLARPHPDVVCTELQNGESVLLHLSTQTYYSLNETGAQIWQSLERGLSVADITQVLEQRYHVTSAQAQQSVTTLLEELAAANLVAIDPTPPSA